MILSINFVFWTIIAIVIIFIFTLLVYQMIQRSKHYPFLDNDNDDDTLDEQLIEKILEPHTKYYKLAYNNNNNSSENDIENVNGAYVNAIKKFKYIKDDTADTDILNSQINTTEMNQKHVQKLNTIPDDYGFFDDDFHSIEM
ncbi:putative protein [Drosophila innubila nudivirus]|uniref:Uncharacterized protein n=1 Tax=Drosophila innubila nudivirus TaxID=2057187 RepID=A0A2H4UXC8_9VIRU|nr:putative protein [Drosophila innubila nudivirus]ATZ81570.1 putative protein [Drosophila innubila nudivirus]